MPDISMCASAECTKKDFCYRHVATPSYLQSYSDFTDVCSLNGFQYFIHDNTVTPTPGNNKTES